jgi:NADPH2:quinone reductase
MAKQLSGDALQLRSMIKREGTLELSLATIPIPQPKDDEVLVRVEASSAAE